MRAVPKVDDSAEAKARARLLAYFVDNDASVFYSRQLEVLFEDEYFHWITNRALRNLIAEGKVRREQKQLGIGSTLNLVWHSKLRFAKRAASEVHRLVDQYTTAATDGTLGMQGEHLVLAAFARRQYVLIAEESNSYDGKSWTASNHDFDFIFAKGGDAFGVEVKNTLGYMDFDEFRVKTTMALHLGIRPVFAVRMMPATWISTLSKLGGYAMIMKWQFYPWTHAELTRELRAKLKLPVDTTKKIEGGTMDRFERYLSAPWLPPLGSVEDAETAFKKIAPVHKSRELED